MLKRFDLEKQHGKIFILYRDHKYLARFFQYTVKFDKVMIANDILIL